MEIKKWLKGVLDAIAKVNKDLAVENAKRFARVRRMERNMAYADATRMPRRIDLARFVAGGWQRKHSGRPHPA